MSTGLSVLFTQPLFRLLLQMSEAPFVPLVFLSICLTMGLAVLPCILFTQLTLFCSKSTRHLYAGYFPNSKMDTDDTIYSLLWGKR